MVNNFVLKNGLRVIAESIEGVNSLAFGVMIQNGSRNEDESVNGISHFIEHMFFKGTNKRTSKEIVEEIENVGGQLNAYTSKEATCYYTKTLSTHLELCLDVISDMLLNAKFDAEEIEKEKGVVIEEINMNEDMPDDVLEVISSNLTFGNSKISRPILGTKENVKRFTREDIVKFVNEKYTPSNSVISVCGKFDQNELLVLLEKYFGSWKNENNYKVSYEESEIYSGINFEEKEIEQLHINLTLNGLKFGDDRGYALLLLNNIFGGGASSILFQKIREELGLCYSIYSYPQIYVGVGTYNIYVGLSKQYAELALTTIKKEIDSFANYKITEKEMRINKEKLKASFILGQESTSTKMFSNAKSILFRGRRRTEEEILEKIEAITVDDIEWVQEEIFKNGVVNVSFVGPKVNEEELSSIILKKDKFAYDNKSKEEKINI